MKAIKKRIIVDPIKEERVSETGIKLPGTVGGKPDSGKIISKGMEVTDELKVGDIVVYSEFSGKEKEVNGKIYISLHEDEVHYIL